MNELVNRIFKIWAYTVSHRFLILRSPLKYHDQEGFDEKHLYNIDIEFSAVAYLDIPATFLEGIEIIELQDNIPEKLQYLKTEYNYKVFQFKSGNNFYHIVAGSYRVGKNTWMNDDRIVNMNLEYDSIIGSSN